MRASDFEISNYSKLDIILSKLCDLVEKGQSSNKDYGMVASAVLDPNNKLVARLNRPANNGKRIHAERAAMEAYEKQYGAIPSGSIIITTLSPCDHTHMDERYGESCTNVVNQSNVKKVYCGYIDPTEKEDDDTRQFTLLETTDTALRDKCKKFASTFLDNVTESITANTIHKLADRKGVKWDNEPSFLRLTKQLTGKEHLDDLDQAELQQVKKHLEKQRVAEGLK